MRIEPMLLKWMLTELRTPMKLGLLIVLTLSIIPIYDKYQNSNDYSMSLFFILPMLSMLALPVLSAMICAKLNRFRSPSFGFLYGRGYSRNTLWWHMMAAMFLAVIIPWLAAGCIALPVYHNLKIEVSVWRTTLFGCGTQLFFIATLNYIWIRDAQPRRYKNSGAWLVMAVVWSQQLWSMARIQNDDVIMVVLPLISTFISVLFLWQSYRLHEHIEVHS